VTDAELLRVAEECSWQARTVARAIGKAYGSDLRNRLKRLREQAAAAPEAPTMERPPSGEIPIADLVADRKRRFLLKQRHVEARKLITVTVPSSLPIGILHFGDPHLDDDGTDISLVEQHARLVRETPGLYGANVGDTTNNWIGRLARLWASQSTTAAESWRLAEWFVNEVGRESWLYMVGGNHDAWSGAGDPLIWISDQVGAFYQDSEVRIALRFPNKAEVRVNCRHDFAGDSQWNPAHGVMKALMMGVRDHLAVAGHKHISAHSVLKDPDSEITMHGVRVASYKRHDRYALEKGLRDQTLSPCALTTIDPRLPPTHPDLIKLWWDPEEGADFLTWTRNREARAA
jgi:hypothetical protein